MKLNLGCGHRKMDGFVNVDCADYCGADSVVDLSVFPWPWRDAIADVIHARMWLEHVRDFRKTWRELYRVLKPGGVLRVVVPHFRSAGFAWPDEHLHQFSLVTFSSESRLLFADEYAMTRRMYETVSLRHVSESPAAALFERIANIRPMAWESLNLPVADIEWVGRKVDGAL